MSKYQEMEVKTVTQGKSTNLLLRRLILVSKSALAALVTTAEALFRASSSRSVVLLALLGLLLLDLELVHSRDVQRVQQLEGSLHGNQQKGAKAVDVGESLLLGQSRVIGTD